MATLGGKLQLQIQETQLVSCDVHVWGHVRFHCHFVQLLTNIAIKWRPIFRLTRYDNTMTKINTCTENVTELNRFFIFFLLHVPSHPCVYGLFLVIKNNFRKNKLVKIPLIITASLSKWTVVLSDSWRAPVVPQTNSVRITFATIQCCFLHSSWFNCILIINLISVND